MPRQLSSRRRATIVAIRDVLGEQRTVELLGDDRQADRRIERWRSDGLGPLEDGTPLQDAAHYVALAEQGGRGTVADTTALRLARQGFPCRRYGEVLRRMWGSERSASAPTDPYGAGEDASLDLGTALVDDLGQPSAGPVDQLFRETLSAVRRQVGQGRRLEAALGDVAALAMGGVPIEAENPVGREWPHTSPNVKPWTLPAGPSPLVQVATVVEYDLPEVVANIPVAEAVLASLGTSLDGEDLGDIAALYAPMQVLWSRRYRYAAQAWARTGGAWEVAFGESTPQFAMAAEQLHPHDGEDHGPGGVGGLVLEANIGAQPDTHDERLVLHPPDRKRQP